MALISIHTSGRKSLLFALGSGTEKAEHAAKLQVSG
jgi:hypothetical protein